MTPSASAQIAPISRRAIGFLIDAFIATGLVIVLGGGLVVAATLAGTEGMLPTLLIGGMVVLALLLGWFLIYTGMQARGGSIGMRAQGLHLISAADQAPLGFGRALVRNIVFGLACSIVVGYFTPLFDGSGRFQGWHDKAVRSLMVDARATGRPALASDHAPETTPAPAPARPVASETRTAPSDSRIPARATAVSPPAPAAAMPAPAAMTPAPPRPVPPSPPDDGSLIAFVPGITAEAAQPPRLPMSQADSAADLDATVLGHRPAGPAAPILPPVSSPERSDAETGLGDAGAPVPEDTRISIPGHRLVFTWDDGTRVSVSRRTIFGRNPAPEDGAVVVPVRDETLSLSKTHFEAAAESSGGWVLDRHSTNGMTLVREGQRIACPAGQRVPIRLGDAIEIGDRIVTIGGYA